jgi:uncharacterized protein (TIGR03437 family)
MKRVLFIVVAGFSVSAIHAQTCPSPNFLQGSSVTVFASDRASAAGLQRQADGSFTRQRYSAFSPYKRLDSIANYQQNLVNCSAAGARTFKTAAGWVPLADQPMAPTQTMVVSDFLGSGTPVGLAVVKGGYSAGPAVDSLLVGFSNADGTVKSHAYYAVSAHPAGLLVADLNKDGKKDVIVVSAGSGSASDTTTITVLLGKGDGTFQPAVHYAAHGDPAAAVAYDFNGDHNLDLAVANAGSGDISILLGRGDGTFAAPVNYPATASLAAIALGDFNGDGRMDLVAGGGKNLSMLLGNGDGTFRAASNLAQTISPSSLAAGDFNKDGKLDLAVADSLGNTVSILLGDGAGKFNAEYDYIAGYEPANLFAMDLDGDGNLDVVIGTGHPDVLLQNYYSDYVMALFGRGDGTLIGPPTYSTGSRIGAVVLADFDGDGKPDVAAAAGDVWILLSKGGGSFRTPVRLPAPTGNNSSPSEVILAAADFNGDGKQDLVVGSPYGDGVYVYLGNGDGTFQTPVLYTTGGSVSSIAVADFNGDGKPDIAACGLSYSTPTNANAGILLGNGNGTFQSVKKITGAGAGPHWLVAGDFNQDGKTDLAIANEGILGDKSTDNGGVLVFLGQGNGSFQSPLSYAAGINPKFITAADVNGDNIPDLLVATPAPNFVYKVAVLLGNGNGTFGAANLQPTTYGPAWIAVADLNGDGIPDLAIAHCCGETDTTFKFGNGDGTFQPDVHLAASVSPATLQVADLNGDGKPDLVIGLGGFGSAVAVFMNISAAPITNVNGASFLSGSLAPSSWATAFGTGLATVTQSDLPLPTSFGGTSVTVTDALGVQRLAPLNYVSPTQLNYLVPIGTALGPATVTVSLGSAVVASGSVTIAAIGPGLFLSRPTNLVSGDVIRVRADNSQSKEDVYALNASGAVVPAPIDLGPATDQVFLELFATGLRGHSAASSSVTVTAGGVSLPVSYASAQPVFAGEDQIDVLLPQSLAGKGDVTIQVTVDGQAANPGHVTIK